ncbi:hypothetical protein DFP72DRAFT_810016 [Ephemerocybe angulata]|uniref:Phytanoyl-CoA dioxygenase family protein n=1 Tax=Ephemerocybe angulata TaxID=980116 RepID=A0A8H6I2I5_9AGAR|nr:hypothetical protein DFP72DRAFT_810016 [Tulosesus angulatus]
MHFRDLNAIKAYYKTFYDKYGYVVIPSNAPISLIPSYDAFFKLQESCERAISKTRSGEWPHRRTVGKQFPPYGEDNPDSWGVQHLMHFELQEWAFAEWYCSDRVLDAVTLLLGCQREDLQMELFNLLINPTSHDFALRWHRDDVRERASYDEEVHALAKWHTGIQWNTALYHDECLYVVPESHMIPRTQAQRSLSRTQAPPKDPMRMPGAVKVVLEPGDTVFYNSNILHCATYSSATKRATLHACMGNAARGGLNRARNILQHDLKWMKDPWFWQSLPHDTAKRMLDRLIDLQEAQEGQEVSYSLSG